MGARTAPQLPPRTARIFGQPAGLYILFLTEMWEKFSFFGMRAVLIYYMVRKLGFEQASASIIYGTYTGLVYFTPIFGGIAADRWLGRKRAIVAGASIMAAGHFMLAFEVLFFPALATIAIGNGLFLPSLPSQIGSLYSDDDPRRASAYNIYYVGVNLGAFIAPLACGTIGEIYGWHYAFGLAGLGMLTGLAIYLCGRRFLPPDRPSSFSPETQSSERLQGRIGMLFAIGGAVVVFRAAYEQMGNTIALWAGQVDRSAMGFTIPMTWFQSLDPLLVLLLTPILVALWARRSRASGRPPALLRRMALGAFIVSLAYLLLAASAALAAANGARSHWTWLAAFFLVLTIGELHILPTGLAVFGRLAPNRVSATIISGWFAAGFIGNFLAGFVGTLWSRMPPYLFFTTAAAIASLSAGLLLLIDRFARIETPRMHE